ncbi:chemotaxis protein CheC [Bacillus sp. FJAT-44742]|uniref:chemotaxis protein CheC n=1 Tax=Bacillus sp. FJAT-44742 TaxID=2014005 RepID=UPI000C23E353|nr:chemotaxis protein CheC [Bacillus sp. FJAT-44742]
MDFIQSFHLDILKEAANIGAGNAATSLSKLTKEEIEMNVPEAVVMPFRDIPNHIGGAEKVMASVFFRLTGEAKGNMFFMLPEQEARAFLFDLTGTYIERITDIQHDPMAVSSLQEVGNILAGSYLTSLSEFLHVRIQHSVPSLAIDMAGAILEHGLLEWSEVGEYALVMSTVLKKKDSSHQSTGGHFFLLPDPETFVRLFQSLGVKGQ